MKKFQSLLCATVCLFAGLSFQSCDSDGYSIGDFTPPLWATTRVTGNAFYLDCDVWGTLWPVNTNLAYYPADGQRVITVFNPLADNYEGFDHAVKILDLREVLTKEVEEVTPETEEEYGNDPITIYQGDMGISGGYLNVIFYQDVPADDTKHRISLVKATDSSEEEAADGYIHLELRYNTYDSLSGFRQFSPVSFNLNSLEITDATKGIKIKLNSEVNGEVEVVFEKMVETASLKNIDNLDTTSGVAQYAVR